MTIHYLDIKCTFLQGKPFCEFDNQNIWELNITIYGLKDASEAWNFRVKDKLVKLGA